MDYTTVNSKDEIISVIHSEKDNKGIARDEKTPEQLLSDDYTAFIKVRWRSIRKLDEIDALIAIGDVLLVRCAGAKPALFSTRRPIMIMRKSVQSRLLDLRTHRRKLERINASKVTAMQRMREDATRYRAENQVLPVLLHENAKLRSTNQAMGKAGASDARKAMTKPVMDDLIRTGYPINGTPEEIAQWQAKIVADRNQAGTNAEYDSIISRMNSLENERQQQLNNGQTVPDTNQEQIQLQDKQDKQSEQLSENGDKLGAIDDWLK